MYPKWIISSDPNKIRNVKREIFLLKKLDHPNIIKLYHAIDDKQYIILVMEYIGKQSLKNYLKLTIERKIPEKEAKKIFQ